MLTELGMLQDLNGEYLLKVAKDIEVSASGLGDSPGVSEVLNECRERGRRLLRYLKQSESCSDIYKARLCSELRVVSFIPVLRPISATLGGYITYESSLCSFDEVLATSAAPLGFSVIPVLDEDIAPPQIYFSSLAVTTSPPIEVVLRHLRNLTLNCGDLLDRWNNTQISIKDTFSALFSFLMDHWQTIVPAVKNAIKCSQMVPVGHFLVRPSRLFFRLQGEDLSPFMHEVPRCFGAHEKFLKELGVKEQPEAEDYVEVRHCFNFNFKSYVNDYHGYTDYYLLRPLYELELSFHNRSN